MGVAVGMTVLVGLTGHVIRRAGVALLVALTLAMIQGGMTVLVSRPGGVVIRGAEVTVLLGGAMLGGMSVLQSLLAGAAMLAAVLAGGVLVMAVLMLLGMLLGLALMMIVSIGVGLFTLVAVTVYLVRIWTLNGAAAQQDAEARAGEAAAAGLAPLDPDVRQAEARHRLGEDVERHPEIETGP